MKKVAILVLIIVNAIQAKESLLDDTLDQFTQRCVKDTDELLAFKNYYSNFLEKTSRLATKKKHKKFKKRHKKIAKVLKRYHPHWYKEISPYIAHLEDETPTKDVKKARRFLTRFDSLQSMRNQQISRYHNFKYSTESHLYGLKDRIKTRIASFKSKQFFTRKKNSVKA